MSAAGANDLHLALWLAEDPLPRPLARGRASKDIAMPPQTGSTYVRSLVLPLGQSMVPELIGKLSIAARLQDDPFVPATVVVHYMSML
jgi:hypothetical protein